MTEEASRYVRLSHLPALAVLAALAVALFAVIQSASAADGSIKIELGESGDITGIPAGYETVASTDTDIATVGGLSTTPDSTPPTQQVTVSAVVAGSTTVTITDTTVPDGEEKMRDLTYEVEVVPFGIAKIEFVDESDGIVKAGTLVTVRVTLQSQVNDSNVTLTVPTTGLSIQTDTGTSQSDNEATGSDKTADWTLNTAGAPDGEYTLTLTADQTSDDDGTADAVKDVTDTIVLKIGDPGVGLASAALGPANVKGGAPSTAADAAPDKTTKKFGSTIYLAVTASNSLGESSNASDVDQVIVFAIGANVGDHTGAEAAREVNSKSFVELTTDDPDVDNVGAATVFSVTSGKPATVTVNATVIGSSGSVASESFDVVFTGNAESISLGDPSDQLGQKGDKITVELTAADAAGNSANISPIQTTSVRVLDADGGVAKNLSASEAQKVDAADNTVDTALTITVSSDDTNKADSGTYTLEVKLGSKSTATAEFTVVGDPGAIDVVASATSSDTIGDIITVTATVTDADGNPVSNGIDVNFSVSQMTGLAAIGTNHRNTSPAGEDSNGPMTKDGSASVKYAVVGAGTSVISATSGAATGVAVIVSTAGMAEPDAMPEEEASVGCLSNLAGFATWACGVESSASEIFGLVSGRGATALHLWNGSAWVRYSVVDGTMVPGSSDFMVAENDILYISN